MNNEPMNRVIRKKYSAQFKDQAVERAAKDGVPLVAKDLGLSEATLYSWRSKRQQGGDTLENQKLQQAELARLKRENARIRRREFFFKKGGNVLHEGIKMKYAMIKANQEHYCIRLH